MSVASKNLFSLLQDDASEAVEATQQSSPQAAKADQASPQSRSNQTRGRGPASRGGRYYQRGGKTSAATEEAPEESGENQARSDNRGRGRGGRGRGGGRGGGGAPRRGREHDRQSGTLPVSDKRVAQGWGGEDGERELQNEEQGVADASADTVAAGNDWGGTPAVAATDDWAGTGTAAAATDDWAGTGNTAAADDWATPADGGAAATGDNAAGGDGANANKDAGNEYRRRRQQEEEEDENLLTLEQYLAQKKENSTGAIPQLEGIRKANEGSDDSLWKNAVENKKNEDESYFVGKTKGPAKARTKKAEKEFIEIEPRFERPERGRGRGGRGGSRGGAGEERRGGGRGRGSRGGGGGARGGGNDYNRSSNANSGQVDVADQSAFPSLS